MEKTRVKFKGNVPPFHTWEKTQKIDGVKYLYLWCTHNKKTNTITRSYVYRRYVNGKSFMHTFGTIESRNFWEILDEVDKLSALIEAGVDVHQQQNSERKNRKKIIRKVKQEKARKKASGRTVLDVIDLYCDNAIKSQRWKKPQKMLTYYMGLTKRFSNEFLHSSVEKITPELIAKQISEDWSRLKTASHPVTMLLTAIHWAIEHRLVSPKLAYLKPRTVFEFLPKQNKIENSHQPYLAPEKLPTFMKALLGLDTIPSKVIAVTIFTALRRDNVRLARWSQIDWEAKTLSIPRSEMKINFGGNVPHIVPLSDPVIDILKTVPRFLTTDDYIFPNPATGKPYKQGYWRDSVKLLHKQQLAIDGVGWVDPNELDRDGKPRMVVLHGLARTGFESWAMDSITFQHPEFSPIGIDFIMDHRIDSYGFAYKRRPPLGVMRQILTAWADFLLSEIKK